MNREPFEKLCPVYDFGTTRKVVDLVHARGNEHLSGVEIRVEMAFERRFHGERIAFVGNSQRVLGRLACRDVVYRSRPADGLAVGIA
jgi:hypothetical protein